MGSNTFYPPGSQIAALTSVNDAAVRYLLDKSDCPYKVIGKEGQYCSTTPPAAPTNLSATAVSSSQINLSWVDNSSDETGFKIERKRNTSYSSYSQIATVGANVTSFQNTGLAAKTGYTYRVRAYNSRGNSAYSNTASATTQSSSGSALAAPSSLQATAASASQINLSWADNAGDETGFRVERKQGSSGSYSEIATVGANVTSYQSTGLTTATTYFYRVRAYNSAGSSAYSNEAGATTKTATIPR
jgi:hypothetical protein